MVAHFSLHMCVRMHMHTHTYIYIYGEEEKEWERGGDEENEIDKSLDMKERI